MLTLDDQNQLREAYRALHPTWMPATERYACLVKERLLPDTKLLDLGCGRGGLIEQLNHPLAYTVGIDPDFVSLVEHRMPAFPRTAALSHQLPFANNQFDLVFSAWVLEHMATPAIDFTQIQRVLKPNGQFIFITPNRKHPLIRLNRGIGRVSAIQTRLVSYFYGREPDDTFPAYYRANAPADLAQLGQKVGLTLTHLDIIPDPTYWGILPKYYKLLCRWDAGISPQNQLHLVGIYQKK